MWVQKDGQLRQTVDHTRVKFRTSISAKLLDELKVMAEKHGTFVNYLFEDGLVQLLQQETIQFSKETRPKDRIQYKTTYDSQLLAQVREFAKEHELYINDVIEYSTQFIDVARVKEGNHRYRVE